jgi:hypothetical protein
LASVGGPLNGEVLHGLIDIVRDHVDVAGLAGSAHGDVRELSAAAVGEDVGSVDGCSLHAVNGDRVGVVEAVAGELFPREGLVPAGVEPDGQLLVADCRDGAAFARHDAGRLTARASVGPGGGLEALINRHGPAVHVLDENVRQRDPAERGALEELRNGKVSDAIDWYRNNERLRTAPTRDEALDVAIAAWEADLRGGHETVLLAWRRRDVSALNERARQRGIQAGAITGPEIESPGGKRYAVGDRGRSG